MLANKLPNKRLFTQAIEKEETNRNNGLSDRITKKSLSPYINNNMKKKENPSLEKKN